VRRERTAGGGKGGGNDEARMTNDEGKSGGRRERRQIVRQTLGVLVWGLIRFMILRSGRLGLPRL